ncbi:MOSC domain-containing protein [Tropicimonas sp. IMCC34043]|uniref:MOSC domain-containing protein n=1 Tax=Tropicimonas sp. IMCC34043 TaxID=2248760 RepID=UPI000E255124|nr:MOSC domain-containing protein [Tropicimonas sp. IMCC34043]
MTGRLAHICRHPIKSVGREELESVELTAGQVLPGDRHWAIAHEAAAFPGQPEGWYPKRNFVRGVASPPLMAVRARLSEDGTTVHLAHPEAGSIEIAPDTAEGAAALLDWVRPMWPDTRPPATRVVSAGAPALTDVSEPYLAVLSRASLRDLSARMGHELSIHRWRGNLWVDGFAPWAEWDWIGREIRIGDVRLRVERRITRCNATKVNPETGREDADTLGALKAAFGHQDFGVYARVLVGGPVRLGDRVEVLA